MHRRQFIAAASAAAVSFALPGLARAGVVRAGNLIALKCLGAVNGPRYLDGRTGDGSVGLAPDLSQHFSGTKWQVWSGGGQFELKCLGAVEGSRWLDGRTADGSVGLAPNARPPFTGTHWTLIQLDPANPDIVGFKCLGNLPGPRWLDGRTGNGSVGLAPSTDPPFTGTRWLASYYPTIIDNG